MDKVVDVLADLPPNEVLDLGVGIGGDNLIEEFQDNDFAGTQLVLLFELFENAQRAKLNRDVFLAKQIFMQELGNTLDSWDIIVTHW